MAVGYGSSKWTGNIKYTIGDGSSKSRNFSGLNLVDGFGTIGSSLGYGAEDVNNFLGDLGLIAGTATQEVNISCQRPVETI